MSEASDKLIGATEKKIGNWTLHNAWTSTNRLPRTKKIFPKSGR